MNENNIRTLAMRMKLITVEDMNQFTIAQLVYLIANKINELMTNVDQFETEVDDTIKEQNEAIQYLLNEGMVIEVEKIFSQWIQDGTFDRLINQSALAQVNNRISGAEENIALLSQQKLDKNGLINVNQIDKNQGKLDQTYLTDELLQQIAGTTPINAVPADGSITVKKNAYPTVVGHYDEENLIDKTTITDGHYINYNDGGMYELSSHCATDYITVIGGQHYVANVNEQTAFYDEHKTFISGVTGIGNGGQVIPPNARYLRMSINQIMKSEAMLSLKVLPRYYYERKPRIQPKDICGTSYQFIPSVTKKVKIINNTISFNNVILFDTINSNYFVLSGSYQMTGGSSCLALNIVNNDIKVINYHTGVQSLGENYIVLFVEYDGRYLSNIFTDDHVIDLNVKREITVSGRKNADYTTITEAINDCKQVETEHPFNIMIDSGNYFESIDLMGVNNINLIGVNRDQCVIQDRHANYDKAPLKTNGGGYFENLSFIATSEEDEQVSLTSYAMHYEGEGVGTCEFRNCYFYSDNNSAVGIGMRKDESLIFNQCEFVKTDTKPYPSGAFYCHSSQFNNHSNQHIIVKDCIITSQSGAFLSIDDSNTISGIGEMGNTGGEMDITFINNNFYSGTIGKSDDGVGLKGASPMNSNCIIGSIVLHPRSHGNNVAKLNK